MAVHVFVGPSCPSSVLSERFPLARLHPPIRHGDLYSRVVESGDSVVIVDGSYHQQLALRHKEILDALARGITVVGAASIGALRAIELSSYGMIGVGAVYGWYRDGVFDGDDAVAVAQLDGHNLNGLSIPLVDVYAAIVDGRAAGVLDDDQAREFLGLSENEYYPLRTWERLRTLAAGSGLSAFGAWCEKRLAADPHAFDQKRADCLEAVTFACRQQAAPKPAVRGAASDRSAPDRDWRTEFTRRWGNAFAARPDGLTPAQRLAFQQLFGGDFTTVWWEFLGEFCPGGLSAHVAAHLGVDAVGWLDDPQRRSLIAGLVLPTPDLTDRRQAEFLLQNESAQDRATASRYLADTEAHLRRRQDRSLTQVAQSTCDAVLARVWGCGRDLTAPAQLRGLPSPAHAAAAMRPFIIGYLQDIAAVANA